MNEKNLHIDELNGMEYLKAINKKMPYKVSENYFDELQNNLHNKIEVEKETIAENPLLASISKQMPYNKNKDYFNHLSKNIINKIKAEDELQNIAPTLLNINKKLPCIVHENYFEELPQQVLGKIKEQQQEEARVQKIWHFYQAAAAIVGIVLMISVIVFNRSSEQIFSTELKKMSNEQLQNNYDSVQIIYPTHLLEINDSKGLETMETEIKHISNEELELYFDNNKEVDNNYYDNI